VNGELSLDGVFVPTLLLLAVAALLFSAILIRILSLTGFYRFVSYKALVDLAIFVLVLGGLFSIATFTGFHP
jgi:hypothetical protein